MKYLSIDIETTGLDRENCQILSVAAIVEDTQTKLPLSEIPKFHVAIKRPSINGDMYAINLNRDLIESIVHYQTAKTQDEMRRQQSLSEASASDYAHKCEVLAASLRDSQAHCRDLEKQIESALSKVAQGHETSRRLQDELVTKAVEISTEQYQSRDLRSQIESLAEEHKRQAEVRVF